MDAEQQARVTGATQLRPPGRPGDATESSRGRQHWWWAALGGLLLLALAVIFALPAAMPPVQQDDTAPPPPPADPGIQSDEANRLLQQYLQLRARMELENAGSWGEPDWGEAAARASAGDRHLALRQFGPAAREYQAAFDGLKQLDANRGAMLAAALDEAERALAGDDADTAVARFEAALVIEPGHPGATQGLERARNRLAAAAQMDQGRAAEAAGELQAALGAYARAVQLDADYGVAQDALARLGAQISRSEFTAAMSRALSALDAGQTGEADKALAEAERLQPGDTAVRDARQRLAGVRTAAALNRLRGQAAARVAGEDWQAAIGLYRKALGIDPASGFARTGLEHAQARAKLHAQLDHYLQEPARIYAAAPLANARQLLDAAGTAPPDEPRLAVKIATLHELVAGAAMPLTVTLQSDGETDVVIYHVGQIGRFTSHQLDLLPGDYTIVGSRPGYRDVRRVIRVRPGSTPAPLQLRCEEAI